MFLNLYNFFKVGYLLLYQNSINCSYLNFRQRENFISIKYFKLLVYFFISSWEFFF